MVVNLSCAGQQLQSCVVPSPAIKAAPNDATVIPQRSFAVITSTTTYGVRVCKGKQCKMKRVSEERTASGGFVLRSASKPRHGYVMTANHFCKHDDDTDDRVHLSTEFVVYDYRGRAHKGTFFFSTDGQDLCVLSIDDMSVDIDVAQVSTRLPREGERVYAMSAPKGFFEAPAPLILEGLYSGMTKNGKTLFSVPAAPGSSGSLIFNQEGRVVSVILMMPFHIVEINGVGHPVPIIDSISWGSPLLPIIATVTSLQTVDEVFGTSLQSEGGAH